MKRKLYIDIETYSSVSLADCGVYRYAASPDFRALLLAYAWDDEPVRVVDLENGESIPEDVEEAICYGRVKDDCGLYDYFDVHAHHATFERVCLSYHFAEQFGPDELISPVHWSCTMVKAAMAGLPLSLAEAGAALGLERQKLSAGKDLIRVFCLPQKARAGSLLPVPERILPEDRPDDWALFKEYVIRDVDVEREIDRALSWLEVPQSERNLYAVDQQINDRGVLIDRALAEGARYIGAIAKGRAMQELSLLTGLSNPGSTPQLRAWVEEQTGMRLAGLDKVTVSDLLASPEGLLPDRVRRALEIRQASNKSSVSKYDTMLDVMGSDDRARGMLQFYGSRTGRWAGRFVQVQNLPHDHPASMDEARRAVLARDYDLLELGWGDVPVVLSQLIRTAFIAPKGHTLVVCDFSAIEARVLAWLAGETWVLDAFRAGADIYCETASQMFGVPVEKHGANAHLRAKGKVAVLALGYQGGVGALDRMGGKRMGMTDEEERELVLRWRGANRRIADFWSAVERAAYDTVAYGTPHRVKTEHASLAFRMEGRERLSTLTVSLPSGRRLCYPEAAINASNRVTFKGTDQTTGRWTTLETYGGKLTENITQAVARDCLADVLLRWEREGEEAIAQPVMHIHDEVVMETAERDADEALSRLQSYFAQSPSWADGLPLRGAGYITKYYKKD